MSCIWAGVALTASNVPLHAVASRDISSKICEELDPPVLVDPTIDLETHNDAVSVSGIAVAGQLVTITRNAVGAGTVTVASDGTFMMLVPLVAGQNQIYAQTTNDCDTIRRSSGVVITRIVDLPQQLEPTQQTPIPDLVPVVGRSPEKTNEQGGAPDESGPQEGPAKLGLPRITYPSSGIQISEGSIRVAGTADVGSVILVFVNGAVMAQVNVSETGHWATRVGLVLGRNTIYAQAARDGQTTVSERVIVDYTRKGVSRLIDQPYNITVQAVSVGAASLAVGAGIFVVHRWPGVRKWFVRKK